MSVDLQCQREEYRKKKGLRKELHSKNLLTNFLDLLIYGMWKCGPCRVTTSLRNVELLLKFHML